MTGTKDGCREGDCGACLILLGEPHQGGVRYRAVNSCLLPLGEAAGRHVVTIEGLNRPDLSPVQKALVEEGAIQCGFCTPGLVVALTGYLLSSDSLSGADSVAALGGNICRCTGYVSIRRAAARLAGQFGDLKKASGPSSPERTAALVERGVLPPHFLGVPERLRRLSEAAGIEGSADGRPAQAPVLVAGGTDLFVVRADELRDAELTFLSRRADLQGIRLEDGVCRLGAATTLADIEASPLIEGLFPGFGRHLARIASPPVRNRATVGGNIVNASPAGDLAVIFLALNASLVLGRRPRPRVLPLRDFYRGYKAVDLAPEEVVAEITFPAPDAATRFHFEKVGRREFLDIAGVSTAVRLRVQADRILEAHVAAGSIAPVPLFLRKTSAFLEGRPVSPATARAAADLAVSETSPLDDVRGSADYRRALLARLILAHFLALFPERVREEDLG